MAKEIDRDRLHELLRAEEERFVAEHPRSRELFERGRRSLLAGVPMPWMTEWAGAFPVFVAEASGARFTDVDGIEYVDFCLGDTGAMTGHSPPRRPRRSPTQARRGVTLMLPTEDSDWVGEELARRFGLPYWQFALTATDANRFTIRLARAITGRQKILVYSWCYHGTVDETFAISVDGETRSRPDNIGPPVDPAVTTKAIEWNDVEALEAALAAGDVACVLAEPAMTNIGIILPEPGYHDALRTLTREHGTLLVIDETHTHLRRARRLHPRPRAGAGLRDARQADRRRRARRRLRDERGGRRPHRRPPRHARDHRRRRDRRHPVGQRPVARGDPGDAREGADRRGVRAHDRARRALRGRGERGDRRPRRPLARDAAGLPGRVRVPPHPAAQRIARPPPRRTASSTASCTSTPSTAAS